MAFIRHGTPPMTMHVLINAQKIPDAYGRSCSGGCALAEKIKPFRWILVRAYGEVKYFINALPAAGTMTELTFSVPSSVKSRGVTLPMAEAL